MSKAHDFLAQCLILDLEGGEDRITRIGAVWNEAVFSRSGSFPLGKSLAELDAFAGQASWVLGHNLLDHDFPVLQRWHPQMRLLRKPVVDTLYLSPLAFPENPYHRLVKDYKLVTESLNDPVADARLAASLFSDQWKAFVVLQETGREELLGLYRFCLNSAALASGFNRPGFATVFDALGAPMLTARAVPEALRRLVADRVCGAALGAIEAEHLADPQALPALAYAVAWLTVAGHNSVLPPWVRHRFPRVSEWLHRLRDVPCGHTECRYCRETHDPTAQLRRYFGFPAFRSPPVHAETGSSLQQAIVRQGMADQPLLAILPTGGGKSICYQIPALVRHFRRGQLTIVITPLQALMKDQVDNLIAKTGLPCAAALSGLLTPPERGDVLERVRLGDVALLYVAPEQLRNRSFRKAISQREIGCWVFDEAHCLSRWGHDFRPDYLYAGRFIRELARESKAPGTAPPVACFTATAKADVRCEILDFFERELGQTLQVFAAGVERDNLHFEVQMMSRAEKWARIHAILEEHLGGGPALVPAPPLQREKPGGELQGLSSDGTNGSALHPPPLVGGAGGGGTARRESPSPDLRHQGGAKPGYDFRSAVPVSSPLSEPSLAKGHKSTGSPPGGDDAGSALVYCATRRGAKETADYLVQQGWAAAAFHAGLSAPEKRAVQEGFLGGAFRVICATNAFGMGIDKEDVRLVLHADIPGSLENYLQEAGRAGRDLAEARCVLLYDEQDIEAQFRLEADSELSQRDIAQILRGLRRARRSAAGEVVLTSGELLRDEEVDTSFDSEDRQADTRVKMAVSWLERAGFVERNHNNTRVFQGRPLVRSLTEARERMRRLDLSPAQERRWLAVLGALLNADPKEPLSTDQLAELPVFAEARQPESAGNADAAGRGAAVGPPDAERSSPAGDSLRVLRTLHDMANAGLIQSGVMLTAYVRHKVQKSSQRELGRICEVERGLLQVLQEQAPDAAGEGWLDLSLRRLNQRLVNDGHTEVSPQLVLNLLRSLGQDGRGLAGSRGSLVLRPVGRDHYRVRLERDWEAVLITAKRRQRVAAGVLEAILARIPADAPGGADILVDFSSDDLVQAVRRNIYLASELKDPLAAIDRALMFLHEHKIIILQQGLAVFRQAMTIRVLPQPHQRRYSKADYQPLQLHYQERVFQVHVMNEYARLGLEKVRQALELVLAYFSLDRTAFVKRYFSGRRDMLECATSQESYRRIVDDLGNRAQTQVVTAPADDNLLILAGPGSGKTHVVVHRCAYLLRVQRVPARSILVLCFNRYAAITLRRRLLALVGDDARGVLVHTYHGLAMRLTGTSFAELAERGGGEQPPFDQLIPDAVRLLRGETELLGLESDEVWERLLEGYRHILVDEYQDIDDDQYQLISAIAGRNEADPERKLSILAVGDDDQNIYTFRGANVAFIRRFCGDYRAKTHFLVENYRSSAHIIAAANQFIGRNRDRMKTEQAIRINRGREHDARGGVWEERDPVSRGRVQVIAAGDSPHQARALAAELLRLREIDPALAWSDCAVLARTHESLMPIRAACEYYGIPVASGLNRDKTPALHRIREVARLLDALQQRRSELLRATDLDSLLRQLSGADAAFPKSAATAFSSSESTTPASPFSTGGSRGIVSELPSPADWDSQATASEHQQDQLSRNPWWGLLHDWIADWRDETGDAPMPCAHIIEALYGSLAEQRREQNIGQGVFLSTVHGAKGMEFPVVMLPDGGWLTGKTRREAEEERRLYYVGMTRARDLLCLFARRDLENPHVRLLSGNFLVHRTGVAAGGLSAVPTRKSEHVVAYWDATSVPSPSTGEGRGEGEDAASPPPSLATHPADPSVHEREEQHLPGAIPATTTNDETPADIPSDVLQRRYALLSLQDMFLSYAGYRPPTDSIHAHLAALEPGDPLTPRSAGDRIELQDPRGHVVAALSKSASNTWLPRLPKIISIRVLALIRRHSRDGGDEFHRNCRSDAWEIPWVEIIYTR
jgi:superfamily II DNA helicase RecQ/superfamily I DNA/RNA helicase